MFHFKYYFSCICTLFLLFVDIANPQLTRDSNPSQVTINSGVYLQRLPNVTFYQATRQILFRFHNPHSRISKSPCMTQFCKIYTKYCENIRNIPSYFNNIDLSATISDNEFILIDDGEVHDFQYATRNHVQRIFTNPYEVQLLMSNISTLRNIPFNDLVFHNSFSSLYNNLNCSDPLMLHAVIAEVITTYEWSRSFTEMCQNKRLKLDIVPMVELNKALIIVRKNALTYNFTLSLDTISSYYSLPITECTISQETALVGLHVPLIQRTLLGLSVKKILTPPFAWNSYTCSVNVPTEDIAMVHKSSGWTLITPKCDSFHEDLCLLNQQYDNNALTIPCAHQLLHEHTPTQLSKVCPFQCRDTGHETEFITRIEANKYLVTHPHMNTSVRCDNNTYNLAGLINIGALAIQLSCNCKIYGEHTEIDATEIACLNREATVTITHILPAEWIRFRGLNLPMQDHTPLKFGSVEECINYKWIAQAMPTSSPTTYTILLVLSFTFILLQFLFSIFLCRRIVQLSANLVSSNTDTSSRRTFVREPHSSQAIPLLPIVQPPATSTTTHQEEPNQGYLVPSTTTPPTNLTSHIYENLRRPNQKVSRLRNFAARGTSLRHIQQRRLPQIPEEHHYIPMTGPAYIEMHPPRQV